MRVLIFGNGWVGNKFCEALNMRGDHADLARIDIADEREVRKSIEDAHPDVVLNCAGKTGKPTVDWCEDHKDVTFRSNVLGPLSIDSVCKKLGQYWVHVGSGCVYDGDNGGKGFSECDKPNFFGSFYSRTKAFSEELLSGDVLQLRLRMPITGVPEDRNLITKLVKYVRVISVPNSVSVLSDFIYSSLGLVEKRKTGIYNVVNRGAIAHAEILDLYRGIVDPGFSYSIISVGELGRMTKAPRSNCVLNTDKIESEGLGLRPVGEAVTACLLEYARLKQQ